jgi:hypothetical protein
MKSKIAWVYFAGDLVFICAIFRRHFRKLLEDRSCPSGGLTEAWQKCCSAAKEERRGENWVEVQYLAACPEGEFTDA